MEYKKKLDAYIDSKREEMLEDLKLLVRIDSKKGAPESGKPFGSGPAAVLSAAGDLMRKCGLSVKNYENYVVTGDLTDAPRGLDILAHLDVVPVTQDWTVTDPFEPKVVDGRIYGRGTADDKGPAIAALYALRAIKELGIPMRKSVRLVLGSDEECGSSDLDYYYGIEQEAPYTFTPDADFPVINIEKGRLEAEFYAEFGENGRRKEQCASAAEHTADGWNATEAQAPLPRLRSLRSGDKANVVPGRAVLEVEGVPEKTVRAVADVVEKETGVRFLIAETDQARNALADGNGTQTDLDGKLLRIDVCGQAAHASTPQEGKNALTAALRLVSRLPLTKSDGLDALCSLERLMPYEDTCGRTLGVCREEEQSGAVTLCFSILDYTPERLSGAFDMRLPIGCTEENTKEPIMRQLGECGIHMKDVPMTKPHYVPGDSDFIKILLESYERYTGKKGSPLSTGGGTYVHGLERGVAFGCMSPEVDNHMHGDDEFMEIGTLIMSAKIFADAAVRICNEL
ncbi:MAG: Sapep family Mn(2+)-dependent dipeptidase [Lachnospiraceae bacterium]|nr:Sapep family Mn(2+)-dependent dipeptidase [Lachnospiraceae bacterium]